MRKLMILTFALLCVVSLAAVSVSAINNARPVSNNAEPVSNNVAKNRGDMVPVESWIQPLVETGPSAPGAIGGKSNASHMALGYFMGPGLILETTAFDAQHNSRMGRQVAQGTDGRVHFIWTYAPDPYDADARAVHYTSYLGGVFAGTPFDITAAVGQSPGRYCSMDLFQNRALVGNHQGSIPTVTSALDAFPGSQGFTAIDAPSTVVDCEGIKCHTPFTQYDWPSIAADQDGSGHIIVHMIAQEYSATGGTFGGLAYFRGVSTGTNLQAGMYGTCGTFIDSAQVIGYDIAASPYSDKVVIAYPRARMSSQQNADLVYRLSTNLGADWGPIVNVTHYLGATAERCGPEVSVLFTPDDCFHIIYLANLYDSVAGTMSRQQVKVKHWSSCTPTCLSLVIDAPTLDSNCLTTAWLFNVGRITLTQCISSVLHDTLLYATYNRNIGTTSSPDCSKGGYFNGEVFISASNTWGETWGEPVNLTNTKTNGCLAGTCASEASATAARYVNDSLRIEYVEDLDAGSFIGSDAPSVSTDNPVMFLSYPCIDMSSFQSLSCTPSFFEYPNIQAKVGEKQTRELVLINGGNMPASWTYTTDGPTPITLSPTSGTLTTGCVNTAAVHAEFGPSNAEGLYRNKIIFHYDGGTKTYEVPVEFWVFNSWFLGKDAAIRTTTNRMAVNQVGGAADDVAGSKFTYFANKDEDYITDASLIMGNSRNNLSWTFFQNTGDGGKPTTANPFGFLYALSPLEVDSTSWPAWAGYTVACGRGTNRDSTISFGVKWFAPHHVDSADFYVGHFEIYRGPKWTTDIHNLYIAYAVDFDVPADTAKPKNTIGTDPTRQMIYLQGTGTGLPGVIPIDRLRGFGAIAAYREDSLLGAPVPILGGFGWGNNQSVYPQKPNTFHVDSVWKYMEAIPIAPPDNYRSAWSDGDSIGDMNIIMVIDKFYTVDATSRLKFDIVVACKRAEDNPDGLAGLNRTIDQGKKFIDNYSPSTLRCACTYCGDANSSGGDHPVDVGDAVFLIQYIFNAGAAPLECYQGSSMGDANGSGAVDIADAVYIISYVFAGGGAPHCP